MSNPHALAPVKTHFLSDSIKPLSPEQQTKIICDWMELTLPKLFAVMDADPDLAKNVILQFVDQIEPSDTLAQSALHRLKVTRTGKKAGPRKKWDRGRLMHLLVYYGCRINAGILRGTVLEECAKMEKFSGVSATKRIETKITQARKEIDPSEIPEFARLRK